MIYEQTQYLDLILVQSTFSLICGTSKLFAQTKTFRLVFPNIKQANEGLNSYAELRQRVIITGKQLEKTLPSETKTYFYTFMMENAGIETPHFSKILEI